MLHKSFKPVLITAAFMLALGGSVVIGQEAPSMDSVNTALDKAKAMESQIKTESSCRSEAEARAREVAEITNTLEWQDKMAKEKARVERFLRGESAELDQILVKEEQKQQKKQTQAAAKGFLSQTERLYLFVSSSMPEHAVRRYVSSVALTGDKNITVVLRGAIGGVSKIGPTAAYIAKLTREDDSCDFKTMDCKLHAVDVVIDPLLYRMHKVERVPALVYVPHINVTNPQMSEGDEENLSEAPKGYKISGHASFEALVAGIQEKAKSPSLERMLSFMKDRGFYSGK